MMPESRRERRWVIIMFLAVMALDTFFHWNSHNDRTRLEQEQVMTRRMLDARAEIQVIIINVLIRGGALTQAEQARINELWNQAEYERVK
jgi:hypothetical protein